MTDAPIIAVIGGPGAGKSTLIDAIAPYFAPCTVLDPDRLRGSNEERWDRIRTELVAADDLVILEACMLPVDIDAILDARPSATVLVHVSDDTARERLINRSWSPAHAARAAGQHDDRTPDVVVNGTTPPPLGRLTQGIENSLEIKMHAGRHSLMSAYGRHLADTALKTGRAVSVFCSGG